MSQENTLEPLEVIFDIKTINHLGAKLYNSLPPILTELVANAWDADATKVSIYLSNTIIVIQDNGFGMSRKDAQDKYLTIGREKRQNSSNDKTPTKFRDTMGRKGIGKLAVFGIADKVSIETCFMDETGNLEKTAFEIDYLDLLTKETGKYAPVEKECTLTAPGTKITLENLKKRKIIKSTIIKSLARSLPVMFIHNDFQVFVDDTLIKLSDRDVFQKLEAIWVFGDTEKIEYIRSSVPNIIKSKKYYILPIDSNDTNIYGWFGTAKSPNALKSTETDTSLNEISIIIRGKIAEQNILSDIGQTDRMVISYMTGEIYADFLDKTDALDIATSSRQSLDRDDERVSNLFQWGKSALQKVKDEWEAMRESANEDELKSIEPALKEYYDMLSPVEKIEAKKFYKLAGKVHFEDRATLYRSITLAYEKIRRSGKTLALGEKLNNDNVELFVELVKEVDEIEQLSYYEIAKKRLEVMYKAKEYLESNIIEGECQRLIYKNLWVLNPIWEKYHTGTESVLRMERAVKRTDAAENEIKGRIDIFIAEHLDVITVIELKRPLRKVTYYELLTQVAGYQAALTDEWRKSNPNSTTSPKINLMVIIGEMPTDSREMFDKLGITLYTYQGVISNIEAMYGSYLDQQRESKKFINIIDSIQSSVSEKINAGVES